MKRDKYLENEHVRGFTAWAGQLVTGELGLTHRWTSGRGTDFECTTLYGALEQYRWPDNSSALDWRATARRLQEFRANFEDIGAIDSSEKQENSSTTPRPSSGGAAYRFPGEWSIGGECRRNSWMAWL